MNLGHSEVRSRDNEDNKVNYVATQKVNTGNQIHQPAANTSGYENQKQ